MLIAHRGNNNHKYNENTIDGVLDSLKKDYIDGVEVDVRMTTDDYFVLHHNLVYKNNIIHNMKLKDLKLDRLDSLLNIINSDKIILLDLKCEKLDFKKYADNLLKILKKYKKLNIYLCSFNYELSAYLKEKSNYNIGLFVSSVINKNKNIDLFDFVAYNYKIYKNINKMLMVWTINRVEVYNKFKNKNVYIITDKAYKLIKND